LSRRAVTGAVSRVRNIGTNSKENNQGLDTTCQEQIIEGKLIATNVKAEKLHVERDTRKN
jgi:hypothetical protein